MSKIDLEQNLKTVNSKWEISAKPVFSSPRPIIGPLVVIFKKAIYHIIGWYIAEIMRRIVDFNAYVVKVLNQTNEKIKNEQNVKIEKVSQKINDLDKSLKRVEARTRNTTDSKVSIQSNQAKVANLPLDYYMFEEQFRGDSKLIKEKQKQFVQYFKNKKNVLDIGCGRGEFLELLKENNIEATGIDLEEDMVLICKKKGFKAEKNDALSFLNDQPNNSLGGVFLGQVVEHLTPSQLLTLVKLSSQKLEPEAYFIAETINPLNLSTSKIFTLDLSHQKPVHPETLKFLLQSEGFSEINFEFFSPTPDDEKLQPIELLGNHEAKSLKQINDNIHKLNELLYGYQDYAVIAKKD